MATKVDVQKPRALSRFLAMKNDLQAEIDSGAHSDAVIHHINSAIKAIESIHDAQSTATKMEPRVFDEG